MDIKAHTLKPSVSMEDVDVYLPRGVKALEDVGANPIGLFRIFQRHEGASFFGLSEYLGALASLVGPEAAKDIIVHAVPEGYKLARHETAMTLVGSAQALMVNETLLHYLSTGTRFRTLAETYPGDKYPWVFMGARYLAKEDSALVTRALAEKGILSTIPRWADKYLGTMSHSQVVMWAGLQLDDEVEQVIANVTDNEMVAATIRATIAFARANPDVPLYVLGDVAARSVGCFEVFRATNEACRLLGIKLVGGRIDISWKDLDDQYIFDPVMIEDIEKELENTIYSIKLGRSRNDMDYTDEDEARDRDFYSQIVPAGFSGTRPLVLQRIREQLDVAGMEHFKLVASSGIKLKEIGSYVEAGASIVGIGEEAAYFLNKGETNFTSDAVGYFEDGKLVPFAKEGRELERIVGQDILAKARSGVRIAENLIQLNLVDYL